MDSVYIILARWGTEWDGQSLYRTKSKALFDYINNLGYPQGEPEFKDFPETLKLELIENRNKQAVEFPEWTPSSLEDITLGEAMEWLDSYGEDYNKFPVILLGTTEYTPSWNW